MKMRSADLNLKEATVIYGLQHDCPKVRNTKLLKVRNTKLLPLLLLRAQKRISVVISARFELTTRRFTR